jgi:hypothetical protein
VGARDGRTQSARACLFFFSFTPNPFSTKKKSGINPGQPARKGRGEKIKNPGINHGQVRRLHSEPAGKGRKKKTLVITLGSPPEKGGEKKTLILTMEPAEKGWEKKKKTPGINPGQPAGKGKGKKNPVINPG